jgi:hypothetical protein
MRRACLPHAGNLLFLRFGSLWPSGDAVVKPDPDSAGTIGSCNGCTPLSIKREGAASVRQT